MKRSLILIGIVYICNMYIFSQNTQLYILGTIHVSTTYINAATILETIERVGPDVILCELEDIYFTNDYRFDLKNYPDLLTASQENMAAYQYQQKTKTDLRPYEIEGRNEFYRSTRYFEMQDKMTQDIMERYENKTLTAESHLEWERVTQIIPLLDMLDGNVYTLETINTELYCNYSQAKELLVYQTLVSIAKRDFPEWIPTAEMIKNQVNTRNDAMAANILKWCKEYRGKKLLVICGQQHKNQLINRLKPLQETNDFVIREIIE